MNKVIDVNQLVKTFGHPRSLFHPRGREVQALKNISLSLYEGETLAVVGESGSGKSTLARILVGLEKETSGDMTVLGQTRAQWQKQGARAFGQAIQYVFQDPVASLNPRKTIGETLAVPLKYLKHMNQTQRHGRLAELLEAVHMPMDALACYPHEFSGGQAQRLAIARALAADARILVLDEPVSALDVSVQAQVLLLLEELKQQFSLSYLFISHDLAVVESIADRVAVLYLGDLLECRDTCDLFAAPEHDYTRNLLASAPRIRVEA
ncbi:MULTISPECIES: ABC transporter ATP-binding protein [Providencia]|uniref:ABC transporter ATP-binding protein n=1 Tax=Providencia TaxID=586 RepID=UPI0014199F93|nr:MULTISPECIES: ATP-binding cassette domain-containing protein [Providencia]ELR5145122.1 ABC transporter ATP-binding protein [Providencia rettgeri]NIA42824.1 ABC transporter ATP-binding protein [Providencia rettgeri]NIA96002.1 ABC transporter ATP-binding protein [Providencia rettgeri]NIB13825.1 ABC transporter ATP-binding protein [Providencia rettgeri]NIB34168.1 ABC transporter ATP-binding protein [Providencia rettgeri]